MAVRCVCVCVIGPGNGHQKRNTTNEKRRIIPVSLWLGACLLHNRIDLSVGWSIRSDPVRSEWCFATGLRVCFSPWFSADGNPSEFGEDREAVFSESHPSRAGSREAQQQQQIRQQKQQQRHDPKRHRGRTAFVRSEKKRKKKKTRIRGTVVFVVECLLPPGRRNAVGGRKRTRDSFLMTLRGWVARTAHDQRHRDRRFGVSDYGSRTTRHDTTRDQKHGDRRSRFWNHLCSAVAVAVAVHEERSNESQNHGKHTSANRRVGRAATV